jgi:hypothetical protein
MGHAIEDLEHWTEHGAVYRVLELRDGHASVQLCSCAGGRSIGSSRMTRC